MAKASEVYFQGKFKFCNVKTLSNGDIEIYVEDWYRKRGRCILRPSPDGSIEVVYDEEVK